MATRARTNPLDRLRIGPLRGLPLAGTVLIVWVAGALYCSGYEALSTGIDNWPGSLIWSAVAVLPWLALFEWSKSARGRRITRPWSGLALALVGTAAMSLALEFGVNSLSGGNQTPILLALMRRLPAIGTCFILILWVRHALRDEPIEDENLTAIAPSIAWVEAADNYVELRLGERTAIRRMTMRSAERALGDHGFVRIHRRYLVNRRQIAAVEGGSDKVVRLHCGTELPVGRRYAANLGPTFAT